MLFGPRQQKWSRHFAWSDDFTRVVGRTRTGRATVEALQLNRPELVSSWCEIGGYPRLRRTRGRFWVPLSRSEAVFARIAQSSPHMDLQLHRAIWFSAVPNYDREVAAVWIIGRIRSDRRVWQQDEHRKFRCRVLFVPIKVPDIPKEFRFLG